MLCEILGGFEPTTASEAGFEKIAGMEIGQDVEKDLG